MLRYCQTDGSKQNSLRLGWQGSLMIRFGLLPTAGCRGPPWMAAPSWWCAEHTSPPKPYGSGRCSCHIRRWCSQSGYPLRCTCRSCRESWNPCWASTACGGRRAAVWPSSWWSLCGESRSGYHWCEPRGNWSCWPSPPQFCWSRGERVLLRVSSCSPRSATLFCWCWDGPPLCRPSHRRR